MRTVPDSDAFARLVRPGIAIPIVRELPVHGLDPLAAFAVLAEGETHAALLETSEPAAADADISVVAPRATRVLSGADVLDQVRAACADEVADIGVALPRFVGGAIGMLGHEHVRTIEPRVGEAAGPHPAGAADEAFLVMETFVVFEHALQRTRAFHVVQVPDELDGFDAAAVHAAGIAELDRIEVALLAPAPEVTRMPLLDELDGDAHDDARSNLEPGEFERIVEAAREQVRSGECVQVVVSQRFDRDFDADPLLAYRAVRSLSPAPYHALLRLGDVHLVGASPEQLVGVLDERVVTHPIAGTRRRGTTAIEDEALGIELLADPKERCEHMMLVDLGRNDVARVSIPGSGRVERLCELERFSHVMHLVSRVTGTLREGLHPVDALRAAFPAGTLTGAPKVRAMQLIAELERDRRGPYGGVVGYVGHGRVLDMAITIRTAVIAHGIASVQAGAGVVAASSARAEETETRDKARAVLAALAMAQRVADEAAASPAQVGGMS